VIRAATASLAALAVLLVASLSEAQTPSATVVMTASTTTIPVGGTLRLEVNVSAMGTDAPAPEMPDLSAFEILSRQTFPMPVRMGGWGGSSMTSSLRSIFVMRAAREGRVTLAPARIRLGGREIRSNPLTIDVTAAGGPPVVGGPSGGPPPAPGPTPPSTAPPEGLLDGAIFDDQAFLRTVVDRGEAYVGEQLTVTVYLYLRGTLSANPAMTREPSRDGFWVQDLVDPASPLPDSAQNVSGMLFHVYPLRRFAAFPLRAGDLEIGAPEISISRASPIDIFMGMPQPDLERAGVPVTVHVLELPAEGRPADGTPHVGTLALEAMLDRSQVPTGDAVTLTVTATGTGRIDALDLGELAVDGVRVLSPQIDSEVNHPGDRVGGTRRIQWLLVPEREGNFTLPSFRVPVFDPRARSWSLVETAPIALVAAGNPIGGPAPEVAEPEPLPDGEAPVVLGPVRTESVLERHRVRIAAAPWFGGAVLAMPLLLALVAGGRFLASRKPAAEKGPVRGAREGKKRLDHAAGLAKGGDARGFYGTITLALKSVVEGKLGESVGSLTHPQLQKRLVLRGMNEALAKRLVDELEASEFARFSTSGAAGAEMQATLERAQKLLGELERFTPTEEDA
jgi:hypothetical protein